jgi:lycopene beta-cyclase
MAERADLVLIGGGLSGLSLAMRLARSSYGGRVSIIEPRLHYQDDRSWAFWTRRGSPWSESAARTWDRWSFSRGEGTTVSRSAEGWCYAYVRSIDFYQAALRVIAASPNITLLAGAQAGTVEARGGEITVGTSAGTLSARHVVDTRPPPASQRSAATLYQSFAGRELRLPQPGFDPGQVELMTDMRCDSRGLVFTYVLPLSATRALVEVTRFSTQQVGASELSPDLDALLEARGWAQAEVLRREAAILPMGLPSAAHACQMRGVVRAGTGAGALRAATGYGFLRIQAWAEQCADALIRGGPPLGHPAEPRLRGWMDGVFLRALANHPERAPGFFMRLATRVPGPAFGRFMSDQAGWADHARVIAALPPGPFLQALPPRPVRARLPA